MNVVITLQWSLKGVLNITLAIITTDPLWNLIHIVSDKQMIIRKGDSSHDPLQTICSSPNICLLLKMGNSCTAVLERICPERVLDWLLHTRLLFTSATLACNRRQLCGLWGASTSHIAVASPMFGSVYCSYSHRPYSCHRSARQFVRNVLERFGKVLYIYIYIYIYIYRLQCLVLFAYVWHLAVNGEWLTALEHLG